MPTFFGNELDRVVGGVQGAIGTFINAKNKRDDNEFRDRAFDAGREDAERNFRLRELALGAKTSREKQKASAAKTAFEDQKSALSDTLTQSNVPFDNEKLKLINDPKTLQQFAEIHKGQVDAESERRAVVSQFSDATARAIEGTVYQVNPAILTGLDPLSRVAIINATKSDPTIATMGNDDRKSLGSLIVTASNGFGRGGRYLADEEREEMSDLFDRITSYKIADDDDDGSKRKALANEMHLKGLDIDPNRIASVGPKLSAAMDSVIADRRAEATANRIQSKQFKDSGIKSGSINRDLNNPTSRASKDLKSGGVNISTTPNKAKFSGIHALSGDHIPTYHLRNGQSIGLTVGESPDDRGNMRQLIFAVGPDGSPTVVSPHLFARNVNLKSLENSPEVIDGYNDARKSYEHLKRGTPQQKSVYKYLKEFDVKTQKVNSSDNISDKERVEIQGATNMIKYLTGASSVGGDQSRSRTQRTKFKRGVEAASDVVDSMQQFGNSIKKKLNRLGGIAGTAAIRPDKFVTAGNFYSRIFKETFVDDETPVETERLRTPFGLGEGR